jgi:hypothetical protein
MSANGSDVYPSHDRFIDKEAIIEFLDKAKYQDEFKNAAWIEPGVGWGRVAIPMMQGIAKRKNLFGDKSAYYGFDKEQQHITELKEKLNPECSKSNHLNCWDITSKDPSAIEACGWRIDRHTDDTNVVVVLASFLSHVPNGLHFLRDKLLLPLLRSGKKVSVVLFQCEQNLFTSLIEGAILEPEVRRFVTDKPTDYYSPLLGRWLNFNPDDSNKSALPCDAATAKTFFKLVDYLYCFKECGNLRRYSMVSPHKVTATDLTPISEFFGYLGFKPLPELSVYGSQDPTNLNPIEKVCTWEPTTVDNQPLTWEWVRHVFAEWVYKGIMDEGLDAHVKDPVGQLLAFAIMAKQADITDANGLPTDIKILIKMYESRLGTVNSNDNDELAPEKASELRTAVIKWLASEDSEISADKNGLSNNWKCFLGWLDGNKDHPVIQTMKNRVAPDQSTIDKNRDIVKEALTKYFDLIETEKTSACVCLQKFRTDLRCYRFADSADLPETFDFRHRLVFSRYRLSAKDVNDVLQETYSNKLLSNERLLKLLGSFCDLSRFRFPPKLLEPLDEGQVPEGRPVQLKSPILKNIANWLALGGLGDWPVMGYFSSRRFEAKTETTPWNIEAGTLFPFTSITAHNTEILSEAAKQSIKFSSVFFDDKWCSDVAKGPTRVRIELGDARQAPEAYLEHDGDCLRIKIPPIESRLTVESTFLDNTKLSNDWCSIVSKPKVNEVLSYLVNNAALEFMNALYRLQDYKDCWGHQWTHCYYYLEKRIMPGDEPQNKYFSGLAIYSIRELTPEEEAWCQVLSTLLVSEVSAPLLASQELYSLTQEAKNLRKNAPLVLPKLMDLIKGVESARALSAYIERQIVVTGSASTWLKLGDLDAKRAFDSTGVLYWGKGEGELIDHQDSEHPNIIHVIHEPPQSNTSAAASAWNEYSAYFKNLGKLHQEGFLAHLPESPQTEEAVNSTWCRYAWMLLKILFKRPWSDKKSLYDAQILVTLRLSLQVRADVIWHNGEQRHDFTAQTILSNSGNIDIVPEFAQFIADAVNFPRKVIAGLNNDIKIPLLSDCPVATLEIQNCTVVPLLSSLSQFCQSLSNEPSAPNPVLINRAEVEINTDSCIVRLTLNKQASVTLSNIINGAQSDGDNTNHSIRPAWNQIRNSVGDKGKAQFCEGRKDKIVIMWERKED